ncbi:unnamed protein product [Oppiella nova]|uniref:Protein kinase domain-containing protein n=1 Tax=Oppiella nova TaxID=334625 RepID=A0A7R9QMJ1_9ACAR|nr:unnamed protein product [Oppiella nova]CAG2168554.1 unnamed protein product [Oppiella nova]
MSRVIDESTPFDDKYRLDLCIKTGRFSCIYRCTNKYKPDKFVVKIIDYSKLSFDDNLCVGTALKDECQCYERVVHKHIAQIYESYVLSNRIVCLVYEL